MSQIALQAHGLPRCECGDRDRFVTDLAFVQISDTHKHVHQLCQWRFFVFSGHFEVLFDIVEDPVLHTVTFSLLRSPFLRSFSGQWHVEPTESSRCKVFYKSDIHPKHAPPRALGLRPAKIFVKQTRGLLCDLARAVLQPPASAHGLTERPRSQASLSSKIGREPSQTCNKRGDKNFAFG